MDNVSFTFNRTLSRGIWSVIFCTAWRVFLNNREEDNFMNK